MIVMMTGLPGTGKSTLAAALVEKLPSARLVSKDVLRAALFDPARDPYSAGQNDFVLELMLAAADYWLRSGVGVVVLDGRTFSRAYQRERVLATGHPVLAVECVCPAEVALNRIAGSAAEGHPAVDRDAGLYWSVAAGWEPMAEPRLVLQTDRPLAENVAELLGRLGGE